MSVLFRGFLLALALVLTIGSADTARAAIVSG
jgi:arginine exporter protein ArgO